MDRLTLDAAGAPQLPNLLVARAAAGQDGLNSSVDASEQLRG